VPVLGYAALGDRVLRPLGAAKDWLATHNAAVMAVVLVVLGIALVANGIQGL
jgi:predicted phage tail protein